MQWKIRQCNLTKQAVLNTVSVQTCQNGQNTACIWNMLITQYGQLLVYTRTVQYTNNRELYISLMEQESKDSASAISEHWNSCWTHHSTKLTKQMNAIKRSVTDKLPLCTTVLLTASKQLSKHWREVATVHEQYIPSAMRKLNEFTRTHTLMLLTTIFNVS